MLRVKSSRLAADLVSEALEVSVQNILLDRRRPQYVRARHLTWWIVRETFGWSLPRIGKAFKRHHTTVMGGLDCHRYRMEKDTELANISRELLLDFKKLVGMTRPRWRSEADALQEIWDNSRSPFYVR